MQAIAYTTYGGPDVATLLTKVPVPTPLTNEVLVKVTATGLNPIEVRLRSGDMKVIAPLSFPAFTGHGLSGEVTAVGEGVTEFALGDKVVSRVPHIGSMAEYVAVPVSAQTAGQ